MTGVIVVHGGAGFRQKYLNRGLAGVESAVNAGSEILMRNGSALDAVESAVSTMEDNPTFNAGLGSSLTWNGTVEMDAAIMDGRELSAGAVAMIHEVKNPVRLARIIMEKTDHVLIAGETAERLAEEFALPKRNPVTTTRREMYLKLKRKLRTHPTKNSLLLRYHPDLLGDTVGAIALDEHGDFAAAASTGGISLKIPGRIGDTPQIGAGLYADNRSGAVTATGLGEIAVKLALSRAVCSLMESGLTAARASAVAVSLATRLLRGHAGVITIDRRGRIAAVHNTKLMPWAYSTTRSRLSKKFPRGKIIAPLD